MNNRSSADRPHPGPESPFSAAEFATELRQLVVDEAPRLFAVVQVYGDKMDGRVAAWGMAFEEYAEIVSVEGHRRLSVRSLDRAVRSFAHPPRITAQLEWVAVQDV